MISPTFSTTNTDVFSHTSRWTEARPKGYCGYPRCLTCTKTILSGLRFLRSWALGWSFPQGLLKDIRTGNGDNTVGVCMLPCQACSRPYMNLINKNVDMIFYPCLPYEVKEYEDSTNHYNCPMVTSYPEVIKTTWIS